MSRRKQGRPQQRRTSTLDSLEVEAAAWCTDTTKSISLFRTLYAYLERVEQEKDLLVCGDCQTSFPLHDIVRFIRHKKLCCADKENLKDDCHKANNNNDDNSDDENSGEEELDDGDQVKRRRSMNGDEDIDDGEDDAMDDDGDGGDKKKSSADDEDGPADLSAKVKVTSESGDKKQTTERKHDKSGDVAHRERTSSASSSSREHRTPLRQKQVVDAESNTTHSEPSRFVCETCRSTYTSAWGLLQHAQKEHGMKIYTSPSSSSTTSTPSPASIPVPSSFSPIDLVMTSAASHRSQLEHHRAVSSAGSTGSPSPYALHAPNPFATPFRLPMDTRLPHPTSLAHHPTSLAPFTRPPGFDLDLINDYRLRPPFMGRPATGLEPPNFHHSPFDRARTHMSPALESHYDYYSMQLKRLANNPVPTPHKAQVSPQHATVAVTPTTSKPESVTSETPSAVSPRGSTPSLSSPGSALPPKLKACEFCGKTFRFQSNLVVHRRSHTGEKPFRCPMCPHACTQQSKLKRHMKTHTMKADGSTSPGDASKIKLEDDEDEDEEEEEEGEEEEDEMEEEEDEDDDMGEEEMNDEEREVLERMKANEATDGGSSGPEPGEIRHDAKRIKLEHNDTSAAEGKGRDDQPSDLSMKSRKSSESLLSEVMKNSGLTNISTYKEAFQAALAESQVNGQKEDSEDRPKSTTNSESDGRPSSANHKSPRAHKGESENETELEKPQQKERLFLGATDILGKALKRDISGVPTVWPTSIGSLVPNNLNPLYSRLPHPWFPTDNPVRLFFPGYPPPRFPPSRDMCLPHEGHNGLNLSSNVSPSNSALKSDNISIPSLFKPGLSSPPSFHSHHSRHGSSSSTSPTSNLILPSNGGISRDNTPRKDSKRNDTCEYCGKVFKNCSNLTVHRRSHTGEKPYKCNLCSYACAQSSKLTRHMKTHGRLGKDVYTCKFCHMPFSVPSTLEKHMRKCVENVKAGFLGGPDNSDLCSEDSNGEMNRSSSVPYSDGRPDAASFPEYFNNIQFSKDVSDNPKALQVLPPLCGTPDSPPESTPSLTPVSNLGQPSIKCEQD